MGSDHLLYTLTDGKLLLLNLRPQTYPAETHQGPETIIVLRGALTLDMDSATVAVSQSQSITIPPGVAHRFADSSDAVLVVLFGHA